LALNEDGYELVGVLSRGSANCVERDLYVELAAARDGLGGVVGETLDSRRRHKSRSDASGIASDADAGETR
jgi:hypothetical protein